MTDWWAFGVASAAAAVSVASAAYSHKSVAQARRSADAAEQVDKSEKARDHEMYRPKVPDLDKAIKYDSLIPRGSRSVTFHIDRTYRVTAEATRGASRMPLGLGPVITAGPVQFYIDDKASRAERVRLMFWPPAVDDPGADWSCRCGGSAHAGNPPHWEWLLEVPEPPPMDGPLMA